MCEHVFIISKGKLVASDTTENLVGLMSGSQEIEMVVKGQQEAVKKILHTIGKISNIEMLSSEKEAECHLKVYSIKGVDIREDTFQAFSEAKSPILEMHTVTKSLEDVFLELTQEGEQES